MLGNRAPPVQGGGVSTTLSSRPCSTRLHGRHSIRARSQQQQQEAPVSAAQPDTSNSPAPQQPLHNWNVSEELRNADTHVVVEKGQGVEGRGLLKSIRTD